MHLLSRSSSKHLRFRARISLPHEAREVDLGRKCRLIACSTILRIVSGGMASSSHARGVRPLTVD